MILPMPPMPAPGSSPSRFVRSIQPWTLALLIFQSVFVFMQLFVFLDIMGGFINAICLGLGWYGYKQDMHITFICYWGMMGLINGALDLVRFIDTAVHMKGIFSDDFTRNVLICLRIAGPISFLLGAVIAYLVYSRHDDGMYSGRVTHEPIQRSSVQASNFETFGGSGRRLGCD